MSLTPEERKARRLARIKRWRKANMDRVVAANMRWRERHSDQYKAFNREYQRAYRTRNKDKLNEQARQRHAARRAAKGDTP